MNCNMPLFVYFFASAKKGKIFRFFPNSYGLSLILELLKKTVKDKSRSSPKGPAAILGVIGRNPGTSLMRRPISSLSYVGWP